MPFQRRRIWSRHIEAKRFSARGDLVIVATQWKQCCAGQRPRKPTIIEKWIITAKVVGALQIFRPRLADEELGVIGNQAADIGDDCFSVLDRVETCMGQRETGFAFSNPGNREQRHTRYQGASLKFWGCPDKDE